jgi:hypothetical protein
MAGGAIKSLRQLSGAASYAVYYFGASKRPFGTTAHRAKQSRSDYVWQGHEHRIRR